jgi:hypothetical protein
MELQEGDSLMAGSRRRENLLRRTFCGTCNKHAQEFVNPNNSRVRR